jgi:two-component system cell cycle response regulator DivK
MTKTVLIVEDDPINIRVFTRILEKRGSLAAKDTEDVEEVLEIARSGAVDLILMDIGLARSVYEGKPVDGIFITQLLKADPQTAKVPVILCTAHGKEEDRELLLNRSGADDFIPKPVVDHQYFIDRIKQLMSAH